jgi:hypothetical protein
MIPEEECVKAIKSMQNGKSPKKNNDVRFLKKTGDLNFQLIVSNSFSKSIDKTIHERFSSSARSITSRRLLILYVQKF